MSPSENSPAIPRPAATVVVVRDSTDTPAETQVLLTKRASNLRFMANAHVFPGGAVHESDALPELDELSRSSARRWPDSPNPDELSALHADSAHAWAAIRETLEEVGLLLTCKGVTGPVLGELREQLHRGTSFDALLREHGLLLDLQTLVPLVRWITPSSEPVRFDARFYVVCAPTDQTVTVDGIEATEAVWINARAALEAAGSSQLLLFPPTLRTLQLIARFHSVAALLQHARENVAITIEPVIHTRDDGARIIIYPDGSERL